MPTWLVGESSSWFWSMLQFFGLIGSLGFIYSQLKAQAVGNMMQSLHAMAGKWDSDHMMAFRQAACATYLREDVDVGGADGEVLAFFEDVGLYYRKKVFTLDVVWERYSYYVEHYWAMYHTHIGRHRNNTRDASWFSNFEHLSREMAQYGRRKYGLETRKTSDEVARFAAGELRTCAIHRGIACDESATPTRLTGSSSSPA